MAAQTFVIDSTEVMYRTILVCSHASTRAAALLQSLQSVMERVRESRTLDVTVESAWFEHAFGDSSSWQLGHERQRTDLVELGPTNQRFFDLIQVGVADLLSLVERRSFNAIGNVGYALHNVPEFVRRPASFDAQDFRFCFRIAAYNWSELSADLRCALCRFVDLDFDRAARLIATPGFAINNTLEAPVRLDEMKLMSEWDDWNGPTAS